MNFLALKTEIQTDPTGLGYGTWLTPIDDARIALLLNDATKRAITRTLVPSWEIVTAFDPAEFTARTQLQQSQLATILSGGIVNMQNSNVRQIAGNIFPIGGPTRAALLALQTQTVSRATELGLGTVLAADLTNTRVNY